MEESKELQGFYKIFRAVIYISVLLEFFEYAIDPSPMGSIVCELHDRIKQWMIYHDGNMVYSKVATFLLICITCVGTRNKKHLEFDARKQVLYPLVGGVLLIALSVWLFGYAMDTRLLTLSLNTWLYMLTSIVGVVLVHVALDNISKFLKEGLLKDRFNFENESFEQCEKEMQTPYSVNIPMRYYYKGLITSPQATENHHSFRKVSLKETNEKQIFQKLLFYCFSRAKVQILFLLNECFRNNIASICRLTSEKHCLHLFLYLLCYLSNSKQAPKMRVKTDETFLWNCLCWCSVWYIANQSKLIISDSHTLCIVLLVGTCLDMFQV